MNDKIQLKGGYKSLKIDSKLLPLFIRLRPNRVTLIEIDKTVLADSERYPRLKKSLGNFFEELVIENEEELIKNVRECNSKRRSDKRTSKRNSKTNP